LSYAPDISVKNALIDTMTFEPKDSTNFERWGHSFLSYAVDKQTDSKILPTPTDIVGVGSYQLSVCL